MRFLFLALLVMVAPSAAAAQGASSDTLVSIAEAELRRVDFEQAQIVQSGDPDAMAALLHPAYTAHLANGQMSGRDQTLELVRRGLLAREKFQRTQEKVLLAGGVGIVMGIDRLEAPPPLATRGERNRRYTNIYVKEASRWRLLARHFHLLP
jgi:ketosteroid isomerase-like protein